MWKGCHGLFRWTSLPRFVPFFGAMANQRTAAPIKMRHGCVLADWTLELTNGEDNPQCPELCAPNAPGSLDRTMARYSIGPKSGIHVFGKLRCDNKKIDHRRRVLPDARRSSEAARTSLGLTPSSSLKARAKLEPSWRQGDSAMDPIEPSFDASESSACVGSAAASGCVTPCRERGNRQDLTACPHIVVFRKPD